MAPRSNLVKEEASIYIRVRSCIGQSWYVITKDTPNAECLTPVFLDKYRRRDYSACTAAGSTVYVLGGEEDPDITSRTGRVVALNTVHCVDADFPDEDEWKDAKTLQVLRVEPYAVTINGDQIYVFGGHSRPSRKFIDAELYDPQGETSRLLGKIPFSMQRITSHAVVNGGKTVLLYSRSEPWIIYRYDVCSDEYQELDASDYFRYYIIDAITSLDGIVYAFGYHMPGSIMWLDFSKPNAVAKPVKGLEKLSLIPGASSDGLLGGLQLVPISRTNKLALIWGVPLQDMFLVYCARMSMVKQKDEDSPRNNEVAVHAVGATVSLFVIRAPIVSIIDFLPIFTNATDSDKIRKKVEMEAKKKPHMVAEVVDSPPHGHIMEEKNGISTRMYRTLGSLLEDDMLYRTANNFHGEFDANCRYCMYEIQCMSLGEERENIGTSQEIGSRNSVNEIDRIALSEKIKSNIHDHEKVGGDTSVVKTECKHGDDEIKKRRNKKKKNTKKVTELEDGREKNVTNKDNVYASNQRSLGEERKKTAVRPMTLEERKVAVIRKIGEMKKKRRELGI